MFDIGVPDWAVSQDAMQKRIKELFGNINNNNSSNNSSNSNNSNSNSKGNQRKTVNGFTKVSF